MDHLRSCTRTICLILLKTKSNEGWSKLEIAFESKTIKEKPQHVCACLSVSLHYTVGTSCPSIHLFPFQQLFFSLFILFLIFFSLEILLHSINKAITTKIITIIEGRRRRHRNDDDNGRRYGQNGVR